ncbi:hypothetical protein I4U23_020002 [Adineta vaga]|nr:hypothetical protein I4U23_020002 [Adineta vaga]
MYASTLSSLRAITTLIFLVSSSSITLRRQIEDSTLELNEVAYQDEMSKIFLGSPSLIRLSSGRLLASHDFFGKEYRPQIKNVSVYSSDDDGNSWKFLSYILHSYFTTLTVYNNIVYAIGIDGEHQSSIIIHRSIEHRTVPGIWPGEFQAAIISCNLSALPLDNRTTNDDPLMSLKHWQLTPPLPFNHSWLPSFYPNLTAPGFLEGSVVILSTATLLSSQQSVVCWMYYDSILFL